MSVRSPESRRISAPRVERGVSVSATVAVLSVALLFGLGGFAHHVLWNVAIVVLALGIVYVVANAHLDRREAIEGRQEERPDQVIPSGNHALPEPIYQSLEFPRPLLPSVYETEGADTLDHDQQRKTGSS